MSWITIVWSMASAMCATLALIHLAIWFERRSQVAHLLFALTALGAAGNALAELGMLKAATVEGYVIALRVLFVPLTLLVISIVWYAWKYFGNGRRSLAAAVTLVWVLVLVIDAFTPFSPIFSEISGLHIVRTPWGEEFAVAKGIVSPLNHVINFGDLMLLVFVVDASATLWRRGNRRRAMLVGGGIGGMLLAAVILARLVDAGVLQIPYVITFVYMGIVLVSGYPLSADVVRTAQLARQLQASEADLRETEQRMELAANAAGLVVWTWDISRDEVWLSDRDRALFGFSQREKLSAERIRSVVHPEDRQFVRQLVENSLRTGEEIEAEYRIVLPDGKVRWVTRRGRVEFGGDGKPAWERGVLMDITEKHRARQETQQLRQEIAHVGRVSTMGQLASALAHELNQPLGAILRNAEAAELFMQNEPPDLDEIRAILADIRKDDQRAGTVIDRMRALLKRHNLDTRPLEVVTLVSEVAALVRADAAARHVKIEVNVWPGLPPVNGDRVHLQQVLLNLDCDQR